MQSGIYPLKESNEDPRLSYCDMTQQGYFNPNLETPIGMLETFSGSGRVMFAASKYSEAFYSGDITFDSEIIDTANAFDRLSGNFNVPVTGTYHFSFSAQNHCDDSEYDRVYVYKNGNSDHRVLMAIDCTFTGASWTMSLNKGDDVKLRVTTGELYSKSDYITHFSGYLIKENYL